MVPDVVSEIFVAVELAVKDGITVTVTEAVAESLTLIDMVMDTVKEAVLHDESEEEPEGLSVTEELAKMEGEPLCDGDTDVVDEIVSVDVTGGDADEVGLMVGVMLLLIVTDTDTVPEGDTLIDSVTVPVTVTVALAVTQLVTDGEVLGEPLSVVDTLLVTVTVLKKV